MEAVVADNYFDDNDDNDNDVDDDDDDDDGWRRCG